MIDYSLRQIADIVNGVVLGDETVTIKGIVSDSREVEGKKMFAPFIGANVDGHSFIKDLFDKGMVASFWDEKSLVEKPSGNLVVVKDVLVALQVLARYYRLNSETTFVGITGSSGKTSTKDIVAATLSAKFKTYKTKGNRNNKLGVPLTLLNMDDGAQMAVIEMGIDDMGIMEQLVNMVEPDYTVITSIGPAHISQFKTMDTIVQQKCWINSRMKETGKCFYNHLAYGLENQLKAMGLESNSVSYGFDDGNQINAVRYELNDNGTVFVCDKFDGVEFHLPLLGKHQVLNGLAAIGIATNLGLTASEIQKGFDSIVLTEHRQQLKHIREATIIDDTYNSNPISLKASLEMFSQFNNSLVKTVVIGDMLELGENSKELHANMALDVDFTLFDNIYVVGQEMKSLHERLESMGIKSYHFNDYLEVKDSLVQYLKTNNALLFKASNGMKFAKLIDLLGE